MDDRVTVAETDHSDSSSVGRKLLSISSLGSWMNCDFHKQPGLLKPGKGGLLSTTEVSTTVNSSRQLNISEWLIVYLFLCRASKVLLT